jgi:hypothetical protein
MRRLGGAVVCSVILGVVVVAGIAADTGAARAQVKRRTIDPCDLLSRRDIRRIAGWRVPRGVLASQHRAGQAVCSFTEPHLAGMVQIQLQNGAGTAALDRRRAEAHRLKIGSGHWVTVHGTRAAFEIPAHGLVGLLVHDHFAQVITIGARVTDGQQRAMAAVVARNLG